MKEKYEDALWGILKEKEDAVKTAERRLHDVRLWNRSVKKETIDEEAVKRETALEAVLADAKEQAEAIRYALSVLGFS